MNMSKNSLIAVALLALPSVVFAQEGEDSATLWGHSSHGAAYDEGPRQRPWKMEGIGETHFAITSEVPEVQEWFDQGITLLHGFWHYEAERSFRWCLKLDPECAMAYWGMALATKSSRERSAAFLEEAVARKDSVSPRERAFIEVEEAFALARSADREVRDKLTAEAMVKIDCLLMDYPDDVEAKAMYWLVEGRSLGEKGENARYGREAVLDDILRRDPDHVGALHYRIHNWDGKQGRYAVESCLRLGELAPGSGHLQHMPGHVMSGIGLWHEAAIAMDSATRVEKAYMQERMIIPEDNWDYVHNLNYLCFIQEQLGMAEEALVGAEQLLLSPAFAKSTMVRVRVLTPMVRALLKFERWEEVLEAGRIPWDESDPVQGQLAEYARLRATIGLGRVDEAEALLKEYGANVPAPEGPPVFPTSGDRADIDAFMTMMAQRELADRKPELESLLLLAKGEHLEGLAMLAEAAETQVETWNNDPPMQATFLYNRLGDEYLALGAPRLAVECYERTLETIFHDGFALAGLVVAHSQLGEDDLAKGAMARLRAVWSDADRSNRWLVAAEATGVEAEPDLDESIEERNYRRTVLDELGSSLWDAPAAASLSALNAKGETVQLADYQGQNVVLIFYLGDECVHCIEQLAVAEEHLEALTDLGAVVLAVSKDEVEEIAEQAPDFGITLLSDSSFEAARRFRSYDDFEEIELHSTFLIDSKGRLHWSRIGGEPFTDFDFIEAELARMNRSTGLTVGDPSPIEASASQTSPNSPR